MKKFSCVVIALFIYLCGNACDICGCSSGSLFIGPYPYFHKHFAGIRYSYRRYFSQIKDEPTEFSKDFYQTVELWGGLSIGKRWQLMAFVPYNINQQNADDGKSTTKAMGDISLLANYKLLDAKQHQLWIGAGLKLATGTFKPDFSDDPVPSANAQPGTGSTDVLMNLSDIVELKQWSIHSNINYKLNGSAKGFEFGDRLNISSLLARQFVHDKSTISPYAGFQYEHLGVNKFEHAEVEDTGGQALLGTAGIDLRFGKINVGANIQLPLAQNLSSHQTDTKTKGMLQVSFAF